MFIKDINTSINTLSYKIGDEMVTHHPFLNRCEFTSACGLIEYIKDLFEDEMYIYGTVETEYNRIVVFFRKETMIINKHDLDDWPETDALNNIINEFKKNIIMKELLE